MSGIHLIYSHFFDIIRERSEYLVPYLKRRASCEKWLQGEFVHFLYECKKQGKVLDADLERNYGPRKGLCDIWFKTAHNKEVWCELQVIVTNYAGPGKPITNQVQHVIEDATKLKACPCEDAEKLLLFMAYPFSRDGSNDHIWEVQHMMKIKEAVRIIVGPYVIPIDDIQEARIYLTS